ncbi:MAG: DsbC family protein [Granulosicoccus sp.]
MKRQIRIAILIAAACVISAGSMHAHSQSAKSTAGSASAPSAPVVIAADPDLVESIHAKLEERLPGIAISEINATPFAGVYELVTDGQIYYVDEAAEYLIDGNLIQISDRANLTDARLGGMHMSMIDDIGEENMLIYEPEEPSSRSITIFTDISCGYCRRLHAELPTLLEEGVRVRYLMFPRAGLGSQGHKDLESVWCADNPLEAMDNAKAGGEIEPASCENPIEQHVALAERVGLRGTPLIYTDSGVKVPGYREAEALATMVNNSEALSN